MLENEYRDEELEREGLYDNNDDDFYFGTPLEVDESFLVCPPGEKPKWSQVIKSVLKSYVDRENKKYQRIGELWARNPT